MTSRDKPDADPELPRPEPGEGAMTGATGSLTPDSATDEFVPAERREISDPARDVTVTPRPEDDERQPSAGEAPTEIEPKPRRRPPSGDGDEFSDEPDRF